MKEFYIEAKSYTEDTNYNQADSKQNELDRLSRFVWERKTQLMGLDTGGALLSETSLKKENPTKDIVEYDAKKDFVTIHQKNTSSKEILNKSNLLDKLTSNIESFMLTLVKFFKALCNLMKKQISKTFNSKKYSSPTTDIQMTQRQSSNIPPII